MKKPTNLTLAKDKHTKRTKAVSADFNKRKQDYKQIKQLRTMVKQKKAENVKKAQDERKRVEEAKKRKEENIMKSGEYQIVKFLNNRLKTPLR
jgi:hypothetical protein